MSVSPVHMRPQPPTHACRTFYTKKVDAATGDILWAWALPVVAQHLAVDWLGGLYLAGIYSKVEGERGARAFPFPLSVCFSSHTPLPASHGKNGHRRPKLPRPRPSKAG